MHGYIKSFYPHMTGFNVGILVYRFHILDECIRNAGQPSLPGGGLILKENGVEDGTAQRTCFEKEIRSSFSHISIERSRDPCDSASFDT